MIHWLFFLLECLVGLMAGDGHSYLAIMFCPQLVSVIPGVFIFVSCLQPAKGVLLSYLLSA